MLLHPDFTSAMATDRQQALITQAERYRLLRSVRRPRKARSVPVSVPEPVPDSRTAATLGGCGRSVAPAR